MDIAIAVTLLAAATAIATGMVRMPSQAGSVYVALILLMIALGAYNKYPATALALFVLIAVMYFRRNVQTMLEIATSTYADKVIPHQSVVQAVPHESIQSQPRAFDQFQETDAANPMHGQRREEEGFAAAAGVDTEPVPYGDAFAAAAPVEGLYPIDADRPLETTVPADAFAYRPGADMGSNEFIQIGTSIDEKKKGLYYAAK